MPLNRKGKFIENDSDIILRHSLDHLTVAAAAAIAAQRLLWLHTKYLRQQRRIRCTTPNTLLGSDHTGTARRTVRVTLAEITLMSKHINAFALCSE